MRAIVVYESMFGDNKQVAEAVATGLADGGVSADAIEVGAAAAAVDGDVTLVIVGSPTHTWTMPRPATREDAAKKADGPLVSQGIGVREWLDAATLPPGVRTAAYDTRGSRPKAVVAFDHANTSIDKRLTKLGGSRLVPPEHFLVVDMTGPLEAGEDDRAREWGRTMAAVLGG